MQHRGRRDAHFRRALGHRFEEVEIRDLDRLDVTQLAGDMQHRRREIDVAFRAVKVSGESAAGLDSVELLEEIDMEIGPAELPVGDALDAGVLLHTHNVGDGAILDCTELRFGDLTVPEALARSEELRRTQKAPDVIGAKRRLGAQAHDRGATSEVLRLQDP